MVVRRQSPLGGSRRRGASGFAGTRASPRILVRPAPARRLWRTSAPAAGRSEAALAPCFRPSAAQIRRKRGARPPSTPFGPRTVPVSCREDPAARRGDTCPHRTPAPAAHCRCGAGGCGGRPAVLGRCASPHRARAKPRIRALRRERWSVVRGQWSAGERPPRCDAEASAGSNARVRIEAATQSPQTTLADPEGTDAGGVSQKSSEEHRA